MEKVDKETIRRNRELVERFPFLKPDEEDYDYSWTWLDDMPEGWRKAFGEELCEEIKKALDESGDAEDYMVLQVKEKFGELRWYDNSGEAVWPVTDKYAAISARTCIRCGKPATKLTSGWVTPVCDGCAEKIGGRFLPLSMALG